MKYGKMLMVLGLILAVSGTAQAITLSHPAKNIKIKYQNWDIGTLYGVPDGTYMGQTTLDALPQIRPVHSFNGEDSWGVAQVTQIFDADTNDIIWDASTSSTEITGMFWGEHDTFLSQTTTGGNITQEIHGVGMQMAFWEDSNKDLGDPRAKYVGSANVATARRTAQTVFEGATEGTLLWTVKSAPGFGATSTDEFFTTFSPSGNTLLFGQYNAFGGLQAELTANDAGLGAANDMFLGANDPGIDWRVAFTGKADPQGKFNVLSDDPILASLVIPEPLTLMGLVMGVGTLGAYLRKRRQS